MRMTGNTILITGGTSGIGRGLAEAFFARGNRVIVTGRAPSLLAELAGASPGIIGMLLDLDDPASLS
ncbi:SDR family NAD(P)-dependent oxidoreductase, partial [Rhodomicrobium vannielii]